MYYVCADNGALLLKATDLVGDNDDSVLKDRFIHVLNSTWNTLPSFLNTAVGHMNNDAPDFDKPGSVSHRESTPDANTILS